MVAGIANIQAHSLAVDEVRYGTPTRTSLAQPTGKRPADPADPAGLALVLSVPGYLFAGSGGVLLCMMVVLMVVYISGWMPARLILTNAGAGRLQRPHAPELYHILDVLYQRAGLTIPPQLYYVPTRDLNAFAIGSQRDGGIAITEGLLRTLDLRQLTGVLAHEVSHLRHGDTRVMSMAAAMTRLTVWITTVVQISLLLMLPQVVMGEMTFPWAALLLVALAPTISTLLQLALSRNREYTADMEAADLTGDPLALASALQLLERYQGSWLTTMFGRHKPAWIDWLRTHPLTEQRTRRLMAINEHAQGDSAQPIIRQTDLERPVILQRPSPIGGRYWILRRR
ncbi:M48 family metalloprotease [Halomonas sp. TRM85114]|uniref:zinc metalloprotease HtpX n=1 Tax=Halomonas jincaotanensis TaxID=2810616 RepID=UPI001BD27549|nr:zinc metalloprotease HtpX [Halomonas jincaotanensis]MBS9405508.1 M48 family metalloprotease [Halomonas jincaotanensis]